MFKASNNEAEHKALSASIELYDVLGTKYLKAFFDSQQVTNQVKENMRLVI